MARHHACTTALVLLGFLAQGASVSASDIQAKDWRMNAWGTPKFGHKVDASGVCSQGGQAGVRFDYERPDKPEQGSGADLIFPQQLEWGKAYRVTLPLRSAGEGKASVDLYLRRDDFPFETSAIRTVEVGPAWQTVVLRGVYNSFSKGVVRISVRDARASVCVGAGKLEAIPVDEVGAPPPPSPVQPQFFGVHVNRLGVHQSWPSFDPGALRLWDTGTTWAQMQPQDGPIAWKSNAHAQRLDFYAAYVRRNNPQATIIMTLAMTPDWAAMEHPRRCGNAGYGANACMPPKDIDDWRRFVRELARRYDGRIKVWELWNESDVWMHWSGGAQKMVELAKAASEELKAVDADNILIGPNVTGSGYKALNEFLNAGGGKYVDGMSAHFYFGRAPEASMYSVRNLREMMAAHGMKQLPIWNTETSTSCIHEAECKAIREGGGAKLLGPTPALARGLLGQAAMGVVNTDYHTWEGGGARNGAPALVEDDFRTPTEQGRLYATLQRWLLGASVKPVTAPEGIVLMSIAREGKTSYAAWSMRGSARLPRSLVPGVGQVQETDGGKPAALPKGDVALDESPVLLTP
ncbi:MAG: hypothetical protein EPO12_14915 [Aquabacterium sp.]|nr:MAG: hypothetical protein EPO12_14915 [Aquabacterium sp.]